MDRTSAERQRRWRERQQVKDSALLDKMAALEARMAELVAKPQARLRVPSRRVSEPDAALRQERDALAEQLAQIEAYQPGIGDKARAWVAEVDRPRRR